MIRIDNDCEGSLPGGFFSKLLIVLDWIQNSIYEKEKVYVNWTCRNSLDYNLWDDLFYQPSLDEDNTNRDISLYHYRFFHSEHRHSKINDILPLYKKNGKTLYF